MPKKSSISEERLSYLTSANAQNRQRKEDIDYEQKLAGIWGMLNEAMVKQKIVTVKITSVSVVDVPSNLNSEYETACMLHATFMDEFRITIPAKDVYIDKSIVYKTSGVDFSKYDLSTKKGRADYVEAEKRMLYKLIELETPVVIKEMIAGEKDRKFIDYEIYGSRAAALSRIVQNNFKLRGKEKKALINEGDTILCKICSVSAEALQVNVGGIDMPLKLSDLTHEWIKDVVAFQKTFHVNDDLKITIKRLERDEKGNLKGIAISGKDHELAEFGKRIDRLGLLNRGSIESTATVVSMKPLDGGKVWLALWFDTYKVAGVAPNVPLDNYYHTPMPGEKVRVRIKNKMPDNRLYCICTGMHGYYDFDK